jgi:hypothetical protein
MSESIASHDPVQPGTVPGGRSIGPDDFNLSVAPEVTIPPTDEVEEKIFESLIANDFDPANIDRKKYERSACLIGEVIASYGSDIFRQQPLSENEPPAVFKIPGDISNSVKDFLHRNGRGYMSADPYQRKVALELMVKLRDYALRQKSPYPEIDYAHDLEIRWHRAKNVSLSENAAIVLAAQGLVLYRTHRAIMQQELPMNKPSRHRRSVDFSSYYGSDEL